MRIGLYLGAAVLALAAPASAAWLQASSKHFVIYGDMPVDEMRSYATRLEKFDAAARLVRKQSDPAVGDGNRVHVYVVPTDLDHLSVFPAGPSVANPADLVGQADIAEFLRAARIGFDRVVIDTAPVHAVSETMFFAPHVDAICLVVRANRTPAAAVARALQKLRQTGARVAGIVLNGLPLKGANYYHYQAAGYGGDEVYGGSAAAKR